MGKRIVVLETKDKNADYNFQEVQKTIQTMGGVVFGRETGTVELAIGDNAVRPSVPRPIGRVVVYQDAASSLYDKGLDVNGFWVINASAACNVRLLFY